MTSLYVDILIFFLAPEIWNGFVSGGTVDDVKRLKTRLFDGYDRHIRPVWNQSTTLQMNMSLYLLSIDTLDMKRQRLLWNGLLSCEWIDEGLSWNSSFYGNTESLMLPQSQIWIPDLVLHNDVRSQQHLGDPDTLVFVRNSGLVTWEPSMVTETSCRIDIRKYPFDEQTCHFIFCPWMSTKSRLNISQLRDISMFQFAPHGEFVVANTSVEYRHVFVTTQGEDIVCLNFSITLQRRPTFYWMMMIFPMMTFPLLCPISFLVTVECGEKITLSITVVLSFLVFIGSMNEAMPKLSDTVSLVVLYSAVQTAIGMLTVVANGIIILISKLPPDFTISSIIKPETTEDGSAEIGKHKMFILSEHEKNDLLKTRNINQVISYHTKTDWSLVARNFDKICFVLFLFVITIVSIVFCCLMLM